MREPIHYSIMLAMVHDERDPQIEDKFHSFIYNGGFEKWARVNPTGYVLLTWMTTNQLNDSVRARFGSNDWTRIFIARIDDIGSINGWQRVDVWDEIRAMKRMADQLNSSESQTSYAMDQVYSRECQPGSTLSASLADLDRWCQENGASQAEYDLCRNRCVESYVRVQRARWAQLFR